jgi:hypothetical protein
MDLNFYYGVLIEKKGNILTYLLNNNYVIKVHVIEFNVEHIVTIYNINLEFLARVLDIK